MGWYIPSIFARASPSTMTLRSTRRPYASTWSASPVPISLPRRLASCSGPTNERRSWTNTRCRWFSVSLSCRSSTRSARSTWGWLPPPLSSAGGMSISCTRSGPGPLSLPNMCRGTTCCFSAIRTMPGDRPCTSTRLLCWRRSSFASSLTRPSARLRWRQGMRTWSERSRRRTPLVWRKAPTSGLRQCPSLASR